MQSWINEEFKPTGLIWITGHRITLPDGGNEFYVATLAEKGLKENTHEPIKWSPEWHPEKFEKVDEVVRKLNAKLVRQMSPHQPGWYLFVVYIPIASVPLG